MKNMTVHQNVVLPLEDWFGKPIPEGRSNVYSEVLELYSKKVLQSSVRLLKQEWRQQSLPQPAVVREFCERATESIGGSDDYGETVNLSKCSCGKHSGIGVQTHLQRAQIYAWFRDKYRTGYTAARRQYLESYEERHGKITHYVFGEEIE